MPRTCLACSHAEREAIDKALATGESFRNIAKRVSISPAALFRHRDHVAATLAKAREWREEKLGDTIFDEMKCALAKAWELLGKMEAEGDHRGSIVALREVRECLESLNGLVTKAESGSGRIQVILETIGDPATDGIENEPKCVTMDSLGCERATSTPPTDQQSLASRAALPPAIPASRSTEPPRRVRPLIGAVGYLQGER